MVEASTELLGGAAVTVFLALLFFGVVVLWDVALALRSVGDKIDKLEDNIDDDLTDIAHSLDGMSNAPGGGGGTQLHLSGGTISSGPGASQPQQAPQAGPQQGAGQQTAGQTEPPGGTGPQPQSRTHRQHQQSQTARAEAERDPEPASSEEAPEPDATESDRPDEETDESSRPADSEDEPARPEADEAAVRDEETSTSDGSESEGEADDDSVDEPSAHPRAEINRGRFVTSPDRTAWYATPLDRHAIAAARPSIAGALPDGSDSGIDESDVIAVGPVDSSESVERPGRTDETEAATSGPNSDGDATDRTAENGDSDDEPTGIDETEADEEGATAVDPAADSDGSETDTEDESVETDADAAEPEPDAGLETDAPDDEIPQSPEDVDVLSFDEGAGDDGTEDGDREAVDDDEGTGEGRDDATDGESGDDTTDDESDGESGDDTTDVPDLVDETSDDEMPAPTGSENEDAAPERIADDATDDPSANDATDEAPADTLSEFEFDDGEFEADDEEDVSVEEAVDTMNEDAPAPELSSHRFDVTASETDEGGAVLTFEFDTETIDITGSTERLLQYQMQSFADKESTPAGEVTIDRDRIEIEIHDSDGTAVQQWGEAAVSIIDRTLYLSDNSDDSYSNH